MEKKLIVLNVTLGSMIRVVFFFWDVSCLYIFADFTRIDQSLYQLLTNK